MKILNIFKKKVKEPDFIIIQREGRAPLMVPKEIHDVFEKQKLNPTLEDSKLGMCTDPTCSLRFKEKFLSSLMDLDSMSCFIKNHHIETFDGVMSKKELNVWGNQVDYSAWVAGKADL